MPGNRGHIAIVGGSIAGLVAGVLLREQGWQLDIYERASTALASRGAGITTHDELYNALNSAGVEIAADMAVPCRGRQVLDHHGGILGELDMPQWMTSWGLLYRHLRQRFPQTHYHNGAVASHFTQTPNEVKLVLENGESVSTDYLIGADGLRSDLRKQLLPQHAPQYAGYVAWRGLASEADLPATTLSALSDRFSLCLPPGEHMLGYMVAGPNDNLHPGERCYNWVWYRPARGAELHRLMTGSDGNYYPNGIPHHLVQTTVVEEMRTAATQRLAPALATAVTRTAQPFLQPIFDFATPQMVFKRVLLIGDAAFTARPHIGMGVSKAATDAAALAQAFNSADADLAAQLESWEQQRVNFGQAAVKHSAALGCYLDPAVADSAPWRAQCEFYRRPEIVMRQIAARDPAQFLKTE